jgi:uncharacterized protein YkwD
MRAFTRGIAPRRAALLLAGGLALGALAAAVLQPVGAAGAGSGPGCPNAHTDPGNLNAREAGKAIRCLINERRDQHGMGDLAANGKLGEAAQGHTNHMVAKGCFSHECPGEGGMSSRVKRTGYLNGPSAWGLGENIAAGEGERGSPAEMVAAWMNSPPHRANVLSRSFEHIGVGMEPGTPSSPNGGGASYTTDFGFTKS